MSIGKGRRRAIPRRRWRFAARRPDYDQVRALSFEARQVLKRRRPENLAKASRLSGVTPAAISVLSGLFEAPSSTRGEAPGTVKDAA